MVRSATLTAYYTSSTIVGYNEPNAPRMSGERPPAGSVVGPHARGARPLHPLVRRRQVWKLSRAPPSLASLVDDV